MQRLLDALIESEENRLSMGRALIDVQLDSNTNAQTSEQKQYMLEQRILELEGQVAQDFVAQVG
jgi:hypothetical protein